MKLVKHIVLMIALFVAALPCAHAHGHAVHDPAPEEGMAWVVPPCCAHHSCAENPCVGDLKMPLNVVQANLQAVSAPAPSPLFTFIEIKPAVRQLPTRPANALATLQTIRLLI